MAYTITKTDGTVVTTVADGTVDTTTNLTLVGKNYAGYGVFLNSNFVKLLENAASTTAPTAPLTGQLWWDKTGNLLKVYTGSTFKTVSSSTASSSEPSGGVTGDLWWDTTNGQLNVYNGSSYTLIGPAFTTGTGTSGTSVGTIVDSSDNSHVAVNVYVSNTLVSVISKDSAYTPKTPITGFATIKPGYNLVSTSVVTGAAFNGTADDTNSLGGVSSTSYARLDTSATFASNVAVASNTGLTVGANADWKTSVSGTAVTLQNNNNNGNIAIKANVGGTLTSVLSINGSTGTVTGLSINANYADLAERFEADTAYTAGTVVALGGAKEITAETEELSENVLGVISTKAAYLMNAGAGTDETHPAIAVSGRVPVRVIGRVNKGDRLVSAGNGLARAGASNEISAFNVLGRALEAKTTDGEGTVLAIVKLNS